MIQEPRKYQINIFGESLTIISDESEGEISETVKAIDILMREIASKASLVDSKKIAILAALKIANRTSKLEREIKELREKEEKLARYIEDKLCNQ